MSPSLRLLELEDFSGDMPICMSCSSALDYLWSKYPGLVGLQSEPWWLLILLYSCCVLVGICERTSSNPHAVSSSGQHILLYMGIHSELQFSGFLGQNFVLSFSVCLSSPSTNTVPEPPLTFALFGQCSEQQDSTAFGRWLPKQLPLQPKWAAARVPGLPVLRPLHKIHTLPHCFMCLLLGTHTHSPFCLLTMHFTWTSWPY